MSDSAPLRTLLGVQEPDKPGWIVVWDTEEISIGRLVDNDIVLEDPDASRKHGRFVRRYSGHEVVDLGTSNGTFVNGERIEAERKLENRDEITIGDVKLRFIQTRKDPGSLGLLVVYASQLKDFDQNAPVAPNPESTTLGLMEPVVGDFEVGAVGDFASKAEGKPAEPRDLDQEFAEFPFEEAVADERLSLHLELEGLTLDLRRSLETLLGKEIELPALRIKIKADDGL
jgi:predicted component of type VI protein secretion system